MWNFAVSNQNSEKCAKECPKVLSPLLFNIYMSKLPTPTGKMKLITYADDSNVLNSGKKLEPICVELNIYLATLTSWFKTRNLSLLAPKSSATITTFGNEMSRAQGQVAKRTNVLKSLAPRGARTRRSSSPRTKPSADQL